MRSGFILCCVLTLGIVLVFSPTESYAQEAARPPLPPLPGIAVVPVTEAAPVPPLPPLPGAVPPASSAAKVDVPKLPQLKTIPEIPPAKQIGSANEGEQNWFEKLKGMVAQFRKKQAPETTSLTAQVVKPTLIPLKKSAPTTTASSNNVVLPPPPMEPPVMDALNLGNETPTVDPDIFAFDTEEKKLDRKKQMEKAAAAKEEIVLPLPLKAKKDVVSVLVLPKPRKPMDEEKKQQAKQAPVLPLPAAPAPAEEPKISLPTIAPPPAASAKVTPPVVTEKPVAEKGWLDTLTDKALELSEKVSPPAKPEVVSPESVSSKKPSLPAEPEAEKKPVAIVSPLPAQNIESMMPPEKSWLDTLAEKARSASDSIAEKTEKVFVPMETAASDKGWIDSIKETLNPADAVEKPSPFMKPKPAVVAAIKTSTLPPLPEVAPLPKPAAESVASKAPALPPLPEVSPLPKPAAESVASKAPVLPSLTLNDVPLPADVKTEVEAASAEKESVEFAEILPEVVEEKVETEEGEFEFGELNDKNGKVIPQEQAAEEEVIADIDANDPAFKFWKGHNFRTQVLPEVIHNKEYATRNEHLPKAVYREDLERLLFVAIGRGDLNAMRALLNNNVNLEAKNAIGDTPLVHAAVNGQAGAVRVLLARGANPNTPNVHGNTAMQIAAERGREDIIDALFEMGAKATADYRNPLTPLKSGVTRGYASVYNAMLDGENPKKQQLDQRNRALQALADAGPNPRLVISQGMPGLSQQIIDDQANKMPGTPLTFEEIERKLAYQEYVRKTGDDPVANAAQQGTIPKLISPAGAKSSPVPIPYPNPPAVKKPNAPVVEPIVGLPAMPGVAAEPMPQ